MHSERMQRQIDRLLDEAEAALAKRDWAAVRDCAQRALRSPFARSTKLSLARTSGAALRPDTSVCDLANEKNFSKPP